jgi:hypothetical protein
MAVLARGPELRDTRARRVRGPLAGAAVVGVATLALHVRDPHRAGSWGLCPFQAITGWNCPLCGGLRSVNDLGHGHLLQAAHSNLLLVASVPLVLALWAWWFGRSWTGSTHRLPARAVRSLLAGYAVLAVVFAVYRNTPWGAALNAG